MNFINRFDTLDKYNSTTRSMDLVGLDDWTDSKVIGLFQGFWFLSQSDNLSSVIISNPYENLLNQ